MIYFTSDLHLGHKSVIEMCRRPFADIDAMNAELIRRWNEKVKRSDTVYIVGDLAHRCADPLGFLRELGGNKVLIAGNHDVKWLQKCGMAERDARGVRFFGYSEYFADIAQYAEINCGDRNITLCHYPMLQWRASRKVGSKKVGYLIFGHIHNDASPSVVPVLLLPHALNAGVDINGFAPATFDELVKNNEAFKLAALERMTDRAHFLAAKYHLYQTDKSGKPYILHPETVAAGVTGEYAQAVAYMHDLLEDTDIDPAIIDGNFPPEVAQAVRLMTREPGGDYMEYIARIAQNPLATQVKMSDLRHNMDMSRFKTVTPHDLERQQKYMTAYEFLKNKYPR